MTWEHNYLGLLTHVLHNGHIEQSRAGKTLAINGAKLEISVGLNRFPLLTTRKAHPRGVLGELAAFLRGATDLATFKEFGCNYWDYNAKQWSQNHGLPEELHQVGRVYGSQWRDFNSSGFDQLAEVRDNLKSDPQSRRHIVTAWNPLHLRKMCLPPCHTLFQFHVVENELECTVHMRSVDLCLGMPSDIILYYALLVLMAADVNLFPSQLVFLLGNAHIYEKHVPQLEQQLKRHILPAPYFELLGEQPEPFTDVFVPEMISFHNYESAEAINYELL